MKVIYCHREHQQDRVSNNYSKVEKMAAKHQMGR